LPTQPSGDFDPYKTIVAQPDPYKTIIAKPDKTTADLSGTTGDLMPASIPPQPLSALTGGAGSGPVGPPPTPPPPSGALNPGSGPVGSPSEPLQASSPDFGQLTMAS